MFFFLFLHASVTAETEKEIFDTGVNLFKQGAYQQAIETFTKIIKISPDNADAYKNRGVSYMKVEKFDLAIKDFQKAKDIFPELRGLYSNLGVAWYYKKEYEKAIENYNIEISMAPENSVAYFNRALCLSELNKTNEAIDDLNKTLELKPDFYWALCYKADLLGKTGDISEAINIYKKAIALNEKGIYAIKKLADLQNDVTPEKSAEIKTPQKTSPSESNLIKSKPTETDSPETYSVQAGAFLNQNNADTMKNKLIKNGFATEILILNDSKERTWYVVRSGNYRTQSEAEKARSDLNQKMGLKSVVRPSGEW